MASKSRDRINLTTDVCGDPPIETHEKYWIWHVALVENKAVGLLSTSGDLVVAGDFFLPEPGRVKQSSLMYGVWSTQYANAKRPKPEPVL